jgi:DNA mismatch repair protein MutS
MSVLKEYYKIQAQAEHEFGSNAVVLMEIGKFMECYGTDEFGQAKRVANILNMTCTRKNKKVPLSDSNPYLVGFPTDSHEKNIPVLLSGGVIVVWYSQRIGKYKKIYRERARVITAGTYVPQDDYGYHVCCVAGDRVACIDTSVGKVELFHARSREHMRWFKEAYKPAEVLVIGTTDLFEPTPFDNGNNYRDKTTQRTVIGRVYSDTTDIPADFQEPLACLLDFVWTCHPAALKDIEYPRPIAQDRMSLHNNLIPQLDVLKSPRGDGLLGLFKKYTSTAMGRRLIRAKLLSPHNSIESISKELDAVERADLRAIPVLARVPDMERLLKGLFLSHSMASLCTFHEGVHTMLELFPDPVLSAAFSCVENQTFKDHRLYKLRADRAKVHAQLEELLKSPEFTNCKLDTVNDRICIITTKKRADTLHKNFPNKLRVNALNSTTSAVCTDRSEALSVEHANLHEQEVHREKQLLTEWVAEIENKHLDALRALIRNVTEMDCAVARASMAKDLGLVRPVFFERDHSYVRGRNVRHPLIPRYVGNDCDLDTGLLLYGVNGSGKTCHAKSVALNVILAQAGFYVFADSFELCPFTKMFARIQGDDDLYAGLSSFTVEMTELRSILRLADERSLVIGDELCKGTEDLSAVSLVAACVGWMHERRVKFVFATHQHKLPEIIPETVQIKHVRTEHRGGEIVFLRKLAEGPGDTMYGIEVARHLLGLPEIANRAMEIRNSLINRSGKVKKSRYNKRVVMTECVACQGSTDLHTHHIEHQAAFDKKTQTKQMNDPANLMILCQRCHEKVHRNEIRVERVDTVNGFKFMVFS